MTETTLYLDYVALLDDWV